MKLKSVRCLPFRLHILDALLYGKITLFRFLGKYSLFSGHANFRIFMVFQHVCSHRTVTAVHRRVRAAEDLPDVIQSGDVYVPQAGKVKQSL